MQVLINKALSREFPNDNFVAEEVSALLKNYLQARSAILDILSATTPTNSH
jgi:hypothetical protein